VLILWHYDSNCIPSGNCEMCCEVLYCILHSILCSKPWPSTGQAGLCWTRNLVSKHHSRPPFSIR
jgi:hypothetical protein